MYVCVCIDNFNLKVMKEILLLARLEMGGYIF